MASSKRLPGRRSKAQAARTRARILRAAERLFARKGYRGVSMRDLAQACGVRMNTIQHHFGSKPRLYEEILRSWDEEIERLVRRILAEENSGEKLVERIVDGLFDLYLAHRDRVAISARAVLGEGLPARSSALDQSWVGFMSSEMRDREIRTPGLDPRLLFITVEGILNNHALAMGHYHHLFGHDVTERRLAAKTKAHLKRVILTILSRTPPEE